MKQPPEGAGQYFYYNLYNLTICSALKFPKLSATVPGGKTDVTITFEALPHRSSNWVYRGANYEMSRHSLFIWLTDVACFAVTGGTKIQINILGEVSEELLRALILGMPLAALLLQRGLVVLHASAVSTVQGAVLFVGHSSVGKSTIANRCMANGFQVMTDDICGVQITPDRKALALPGYAQLRLWHDAAPSSLEPCPAHNGGPGKISVDCRSAFNGEAQPLKKIYILRNYSGTRVIVKKILSRVEKLKLLINNTYRPQLIHGMDLERPYANSIITIMDQAEIECVFYSKNKDRFPHLLNRLMSAYCP